MNTYNISEHAKWLVPFLDLDKDTIYLVHTTHNSRAAKIQEEGLKIPRCKEDKYWGSDMPAIFCSVDHEKSLWGISDMDTSVNFHFPISDVNVRPPLLSHEPEKYGLKREGIPLPKYLEKDSPEVWNMVTCVEFLILKDIPPKYIDKIEPRKVSLFDLSLNNTQRN